jgi:type I restriction enzyme S subunit
MELKPGYKRTDAGIIPSDWDVVPLGKIGDALIGLTYRPEDVRPHGTLVLRASNIQNDKLAFDDNVYVGVEVPEQIMVRPGDVLVCVRNGSRNLIGKAALLDERCVGMTFGAFMAVHRGQDGRLVNYLFQSDILKRQINEHLGATINQITNRSLNAFRIPFPPTDSERESIGRALSDVDALLDGLDRLIAKKRDLKQAAMQQLLTGKTRLPGFNGACELKRLGEVAHIKTGSRNNEDKVQDGQYPFFVRSECVERINSSSHDCEAILVPGEGRIGEIFHYIHGRFDVHQRVYAITKFDSSVSARFLHFYLAKHFGAWAMQNTVKATVDSLRLPTFQNFEMRLPPTAEEQSAVAEVLHDMDAELQALNVRRHKFSVLKQAMMQELLTGRTRLVSGEAAHA